MNTIPKDRLIQIKPSPLYFGEVYALRRPRIEDVLPKLPNNYTFYHGNTIPHSQPELYEPLTFGNMASIKSEGSSRVECITENILKHFGIQMNLSNTLDRMRVPKNRIPKPTDPDQIRKWEKIVGENRKGIGRASKYTSSLSIIELYSKKERIMPAGPRNILRKVPQWDFTRMPPIRITETKYVYRIIGRWIPFIGWGLLAADIIAITNIVSKCTTNYSLLDYIFPPAY